MKSFARGVLCAVVVSFVSSASALAGAHTWRINEIYSNADGTVQFIELKVFFGGTAENGLLNKVVNSNSKSYTIPANVAGNTLNKTYLIATPGFVGLPGAPTPDRVLPPGSVPFFSTVVDDLSYAMAEGYDSPNHVTNVPIDGVTSLNRVSPSTHQFTNGSNSPTNYAGQSGSINLGCVDTDGDGYGNPASGACTHPELDCNNNNNAVNPGATELCADAIDNNCNGQTDCLDSACATEFPCVPALSTVGVAVAATMLAILGGFVVKKRVVNTQG